MQTPLLHPVSLASHNRVQLERNGRTSSHDPQPGETAPTGLSCTSALWRGVRGACGDLQNLCGSWAFQGFQERRRAFQDPEEAEPDEWTWQNIWRCVTYFGLLFMYVPVCTSLAFNWYTYTGVHRIVFDAFTLGGLLFALFGSVIQIYGTADECGDTFNPDDVWASSDDRIAGRIAIFILAMSVGFQLMFIEEVYSGRNATSSILRANNDIIHIIAMLFLQLCIFAIFVGFVSLRRQGAGPTVLSGLLKLSGCAVFPRDVSSHFLFSNISLPSLPSLPSCWAFYILYHQSVIITGANFYYGQKRWADVQTNVTAVLRPRELAQTAYWLFPVVSSWLQWILCLILSQFLVENQSQEQQSQLPNFSPRSNSPRSNQSQEQQSQEQQSQDRKKFMRRLPNKRTTITQIICVWCGWLSKVSMEYFSVARLLAYLFATLEDDLDLVTKEDLSADQREKEYDAQVQKMGKFTASWIVGLACGINAVSALGYGMAGYVCMQTAHWQGPGTDMIANCALLGLLLYAQILPIAHYNDKFEDKKLLAASYEDFMRFQRKPLTFKLFGVAISMRLLRGIIASSAVTMAGMLIKKVFAWVCVGN